ncbi:ParA family protein [soil metagenome]
MRTIAFFNQKGGTAKTTSTLNVAAALVERGFSVLVIDLDPQASLTMAVGVDVPSLEQSIYDVLSDDDVRLRDILQPSSIAGVWIAPSHPDLAAAELELLNVLERERRFEFALSGLAEDSFDFVLVDSPPALNILSINILVGVRELVVPIEPHPLSIMVLRRLFETIARVRRLNPNLEIVGFLPTKVHHSSRLAADMIEALREQFPGIPQLTPVPLSVKGAESIVEHTSILDYMPNSPLSAAYRDIAETLAGLEVERSGHV